MYEGILDFYPGNEITGISKKKYYEMMNRADSAIEVFI